MLEVRFLLFEKHEITARVFLELIGLIKLNHQHAVEDSSILCDHVTLIVSTGNISYSKTVFVTHITIFLLIKSGGTFFRPFSYRFIYTNTHTERCFKNYFYCCSVTVVQ